MKTRLNCFSVSVRLICLLCGCLMPLSGLAAELSVRLQYPTRTADIILTGVEGDSLVFRPVERDTGGRASLAIDELARQGVSVQFLFPKAFYDAINEIEQGRAAQALPVLGQHVEPLTEYLALSRLRGNMVPTLVAYLDALTAAGEWQKAARLVLRIPLAEAPPVALNRAGDLALALDAAGQDEWTDRVQRHLFSLRDLDLPRLQSLMALAGEWRRRGDYRRAFELYRKVQGSESPLRVEARLWVAYSSFYLGHEVIPEVFLEVLPEMEVDSDGYSLRELIKARMRIREGDFPAAMRAAAMARVYADATDAFYPELLHIVATLYAELGMAEAASTAHQELVLLFPGTTWAGKSRELLKN